MGQGEGRLTLHEKSRRRQAALRSREDPRWNEQARDDSRRDDGSTSSDPLRRVADNGASDTRTGLHEDTGTAGGGVVQFLLREHESRVAVLACVRVVIEPGHQDNAV